MPEFHNEDMIIQLNTALSSVREALDSTVFLEQNSAPISPTDKAAKVTEIKNAIILAMASLQLCRVDEFNGVAAPPSQLDSLVISGGGTIESGATQGQFSATADFIDHNGTRVEENSPVDVLWSSSDTGIVSVNTNSGEYTVASPGNITITARHGSGFVSSVPLIVL